VICAELSGNVQLKLDKLTPFPEIVELFVNITSNGTQPAEEEGEICAIGCCNTIKLLNICESVQPTLFVI
jgi:hypothetical protein